VRENFAALSYGYVLYILVFCCMMYADISAATLFIETNVCGIQWGRFIYIIEYLEIQIKSKYTTEYVVGN
jgi:hypothetical protein